MSKDEYKHVFAQNRVNVFIIRQIFFNTLDKLFTNSLRERKLVTISWYTGTASADLLRTSRIKFNLVPTKVYSFMPTTLMTSSVLNDLIASQTSM